MIIKNGALFCDDGIFRQIDIEIINGTVAAFGSGLTIGGQESIDAGGCFVIPGLIDIHTHGALGADFCDGTPEAIERIAQFLLNQGVTGFLGTSMALSEESLGNIFRNARPFVGKFVQGQAVLHGINMEGPFFNKEKRGAQNEKYITRADFDLFTRLNELSGGGIRTVAVAPEPEGNLEFISKASRVCSVSIAHSSANYETASMAFDNGAKHVTHLFNGMTPFHHRDPGIIGAAADHGAYVEVICDGVHIHPSMVRAIYKIFTDERVCLISDAMRACGMPDGQYELGGQSVVVSEGVASIPGGSLAGSVCSLPECLRRAVEFGVPLESALKSATINPARAMGIDAGSITKGKRADLLITDKKLALKNVILNGEVQHSINRM